MLFSPLQPAAPPHRRRYTSRRRRAQNGIMLVDVLVALMLTSLVFIATVRVIMQAAAAADGARQNAVAVQCARQVLENVRLYKMPEIAAGTYSTSSSNSSNSLTAMGLVPQLTLLNQGTVRLDVSSVGSVSDRSAVKLKQAVVTVQWRAGNNAAAKSRTLTALLCSGGVAP